MLDSINKVTTAVRESKAEFVQSACDCSQKQQSAELKVAKKIFFRFNVAVATTVADSRVYDKKRKVA